MPCNCGKARGGTGGYEVQVANTGGVRATTYSSASEARAAAAASGGTAWRINSDGTRTRL